MSLIYLKQPIIWCLIKICMILVHSRTCKYIVIQNNITETNFLFVCVSILLLLRINFTVFFSSSVGIYVLICSVSKEANFGAFQKRCRVSYL